MHNSGDSYNKKTLRVFDFVDKFMQENTISRFDEICHSNELNNISSENTMPQKGSEEDQIIFNDIFSIQIYEKTDAPLSPCVSANNADRFFVSNIYMKEKLVPFQPLQILHLLKKKERSYFQSIL